MQHENERDYEVTHASATNFGKLAQERYRLEERAEEEIAALRKTMDEVRDLDEHQRREAYAAGEVVERTPAGTILSGWLANRFGGTGGYAGLVRGLDHEEPLPELDRMATKP